MKQMNVAEDRKIAINFENPALPPNVRVLMPLVYKDGNGYNCILGPDQATGIFGYGPTPFEALNNWNASLNERMSSGKEEDEVILYVKEMLNMTENDVW